MGASEKQTSFEAQILYQESLDQVTGNAARLVLDACGIDGVAIWITDLRQLAGVAYRDEKEDKFLSQNLEAFLCQSCSSKDAVTAGFLSSCEKPDGTKFAMALYPLIHQDRQLGTMAVATPARELQCDEPLEHVGHIASLVSSLLAQCRLTNQLEAELAEANERTKRLMRSAEADQLTKVANKSSFEAKCRQRLSQDGRPAALLALDLDEFKKVNDVYGHLFGDTYLKTIAETLKSTLPKDSIIGRIGGDEFSVLIELPEVGRHYLHSLIRHVRLAILRSVATLGRPELGGVSIGVSLFPMQATQFERLLNLADYALHASKRSDRNTTTIYSSDLDGIMEPADRRDGQNTFEIEKTTTYFQPIFGLSSDECLGLEVLARWYDRNGRLRCPESFSWVFRDHRFAANLTIHIVETALEQLCVEAKIYPQDLPKIWINATDGDLLNSEFIFDIQTVLSRYQIPWEKIVIEINEDTMVGSRNDLILHSLNEIRQRGGQVALDDFGAGRTGLVHACEWPVDIIKIDRSLVQDVGLSKASDTIVDALIMTAGRMGQQTVAEGIETEAQLECVRSRGCGMAQGFVLAEPMSALDLKRCFPFAAHS